MAERTYNFVLQHHWWRGPKVIRAAPTIEHWDIRIDTGKIPFPHFVLWANPLRVKEMSAVYKLCRDPKAMTFEGYAPPSSPMNPTKDTPAFVRILDKGKATILEDRPNFKKYEFFGKKLKGVWVAEGEAGVWTFRKARLPELREKKMDCVCIEDKCNECQFKKIFLPLDFRKAYEEPKKGDWVIEGIATTDGLDLQNDVLTEEAQRGCAKLLVGRKLLVRHDDKTRDPVGRIVQAIFKNGKIFIKAIISKTEREIWTKLKEKIYDQLSIRAKVLDAKQQFLEKYGKVVNVIKRIFPLEVSLVPVPANFETKVTRVYVQKSLDEGGEVSEVRTGLLFDIFKADDYEIECFSELGTFKFEEPFLEAIKKLSLPISKDGDIIGKITEVDSKVEGIWLKGVISKSEESLFEEILQDNYCLAINSNIYYYKDIVSDFQPIGVELVERKEVNSISDQMKTAIGGKEMEFQKELEELKGLVATIRENLERARTQGLPQEGDEEEKQYPYPYLYPYPFPYSYLYPYIYPFLYPRARRRAVRRMRRRYPYPYPYPYPLKRKPRKRVKDAVDVLIEMGKELKLWEDEAEVLSSLRRVVDLIEKVDEDKLEKALDTGVERVIEAFEQVLDSADEFQDFEEEREEEEKEKALAVSLEKIAKALTNYGERIENLENIAGKKKAIDESDGKEVKKDDGKSNEATLFGGCITALNKLGF